MRRLILALLMLTLAGAAQARDTGTPLRALLTGDDSRGWQAVGRLNFGSVSFCTGALIAPDLVLTAAHCMFDPETGNRLDEADIEFLADWRGGRASAYRGVRRALVHPGFHYTSDNFVTRVAHDVAILELDHPIRNTAIVPFATLPDALPGDEVGVVSYAHDRADSPSLQEVCHVLDKRGGALVLSCAVDFGSSGAPIFVLQNGVPSIVSVVSAKAEMRGEPVALGMTLDVPLRDLMAMHASGSPVFGGTEPVVRRISVEEARHSSGAKFVRP